MLTRQGLHATQCTFYHPITGEYKYIIAPLPKDMTALIEQAGGDVLRLLVRVD